MQLGIAGRRALVTGASRGLGRVIAAGLAGEGVKVAVVARSLPDLEAVVAEMGGTEAGHVALAADLMVHGAPTHIVGELAARFGELDIVVHNLGGTLGLGDPLIAPDEWWRLWRLNVGIAAEINAVVMPGMRARQWGRIVHVSSIAAIRGPGSVPYATVKAALNAYAGGLGRAVAADGVVVSALMPGAILTEGGHWEQVLREDPERAANLLRERVALGRFAAPEEVADFAVFLCSERASLFAGAVLPVDGGTW